jgi:hypothetical protein
LSVSVAFGGNVTRWTDLPSVTDFSCALAQPANPGPKHTQAENTAASAARLFVLAIRLLPFAMPALAPSFGWPHLRQAA